MPGGRIRGNPKRFPAGVELLQAQFGQFVQCLERVCAIPRGYLFVCEPPQPTIDDLSDALLASRSAITGAVKVLEGFHIARRVRVAGERVDRVCLDTANQQPQNFDSAIHQEHAALFREGLALLTGASTQRRTPLLEMVALAEFLSDRLPKLREEWLAHRDRLRLTGNLPATETSIAKTTETSRKRRRTRK